MTRAEAVSIIEERILVTEYVESSYVDCVDIEALKMAIKALKEPEHRWISCSERLPEEYGEYRITWTTSVSKKRFIGDSEYEVTGEWDDKRNDFRGEWLLDDYIKEYPDVKVIAWKPIEEPYGGDTND